MPVIPFINAANAQQLAAKAHEARRQAKLQREKQSDLLVHLVEKYANDQQLQVIPTEESYRLQRLLRVRKQVELCDDGIVKEMEKRYPDVEAICDWTQAQMRLHEQERQLSGRPMPGSLKPTAAKQSRRSVDPEPEFEPAPEMPTPQDSIPSGSLTIWKDNPTPL